MKPYIKSLLIGLFSIIFLVLIMAGIAIWFVFTPEKLSPLLRKQINNNIPYQTQIDKVELTFFSTFPKFGIKTKQLTIISPFSTTNNDTLFHTDAITAVIDAKAWLKKNEIIIDKVILKNSKIQLLTDSTGYSNYSFFVQDSMENEDEDFELPFNLINLNNIEIKNLDIDYIDLKNQVSTNINQLSTLISGTINNKSIEASINIQQGDISLLYNDIKVVINDFSAASKVNINDKNGKGHIKINNGDIYYSDNDIGSTIKGLRGTFEVNNFKDIIESDIDIKNSLASLTYKGEKFLNEASVKIKAPLKFNPVANSFSTNNALVTLNKFTAGISGFIEIDDENEQFFSDLEYSIKEEKISDIIALVPLGYNKYLEGLEIDGLLTSNGKVTGFYNDSILPAIDIKLMLNKGTFYYNLYPLPLNDISINTDIKTDFVNDNNSHIDIHHFNFKTAKSTLGGKGTIDQLLSDIRCDLTVSGSLLTDEFNHFIPNDYNANINGNIQADISSKFTLKQLEELDIEKIQLFGSAILDNFKLNYDTIYFNTGKSKINFSLPNKIHINNNPNFARFEVFSNDLHAEIGDKIQADIRNSTFDIHSSNLSDSTKLPEINLIFDLDSIYAIADTINFSSGNLSGLFSMLPIEDETPQTQIEIDCTGEKLAITSKENHVEIKNISLQTEVIKSDIIQEDLLHNLQITGFVDIEESSLALNILPLSLSISSLKMDFDPENFHIHDATILIDKSDFNLSGQLSNISSFFWSDSLLTGNFTLNSELTDITQLMSLTSGLGSTINEKEAKEFMLNNKDADSTSLTEIKSPSNIAYIVPEKTDLALKVSIKNGVFGINSASDIKGNVRLYDGVLAMEDLSFTTPAADMIMTAIYRTERLNHLYLGLDLHMLNIEIPKLLNMIPEIDTIMPMLRSFDGTGEFHFAVETYMDSIYTLKMSTLRGSSSIRGQNLVLMDGENFTKIARKLRFRKSAENKVDSLSAEFSIFRNDVDIYPFLIIMDRYGAIISGTHNLDMTFDYHISLVESPLPFRIGLNIKGNPDKMKYRPAWPKYGKYYRPASQRLVANKQLELRNIIRRALLQNIHYVEEEE